MKRIPLLLAGLVFTASLVAGGTGAFFSDEETSEDNIFTAGSLDLKVDSQAHYAGLVCTNNVWVDDQTPGTTRPDLLGDPCDGTWTLTDLGATNKFFNLSDLKPGDSGENTISLHVYDNPAYACAIIDNMSDVEVGTCTEPESEDGDTTCANAAQGELAEELRFFAWAELDGDNVWEPDTQNPVVEPKLFSNTEGPASDVLDGVAYELFAPGLNGGATTDPDATQYIGLYWCYGDITVNPSGATFEQRLTCDGAPVDNLSQSDKLSADITFYVEQARNNQNFTCPEPRKPEATTVLGTTWSAVDTDTEGGDNGLAGNDLRKYEWFAKAKVQEAPNPASDFELQLGIGDTSGTYFDQDDTEWTSGQEENFTLTYDGAGNATFAVAGRPTVTYAVGTDTYGRIGIYVKANAGATTEVYGLNLDAASLPTTAVSATADDNSLLISGVDLTSGFVLTGKLKFTWSNPLTNNGENQKVQFSID